MKGLFRTRRIALYSALGFVAIIGLTVFGGFSVERSIAGASLGSASAWSEQIGTGEVFAACASGCDEFIGSFCLSASNSCGQTNFGQIACDGSCDASVPSEAVCAPAVTPCTSSNACGSATGVLVNGVCSASAPYIPSNYGASCYTGTNSCGQGNVGTIGCNAECNITAPPPPDPSWLGTPCTSSANSCGQTNSGVLRCSGSCENPSTGYAVTPPSDASCPVCTEPNGPYGDAWCQARGYAYSTNTCLGYCAGTACSPNQGSSCTSSANSCGMRNTGTIECNGSCNATAPSDASCPVCTEPNGPYDDAWCQARGYAYSTNTCLGYCAGTACSPQKGTACTSSANSCGQTNAGTIECNGSCNATAPSDASCPILPTASLSASPASVTPGGRSTLSWSSANATSCTAGGPWSNSGTLSGSGLTDPLSSNTTFTFQCFNANGASAIKSATVAVIGSGVVNGACAATHYNCSAGGPSTNTVNGVAAYTWSCPGVNGGTTASCSEVKGGGSCVLNQGAACASAPNSCGQTNAGTILCNGSCSAGAPSSASCPVLPTVSLSANPLTIDRGQASKLTWNSTNATSCTAAGGFATGGATSNSTGVSVSPSTTSVYQITCSGPTGTSAPATATVTVLEPSASISAAPARVKAGQSTTISWNASGVTSCAVSGPGVSSAAKSGSQSVAITVQSTYTITCRTNGDDLKQSVTVNIEPDFKEF